jgi:DNA-binding transcriptional LysR family regulator
VDETDGADGGGAWREPPAILARLRALRCLPAVVRAGSTARAAEALSLSQPAVARAVVALEATLGIALFERGARGMVPTPPGAAAARRAGWLLGLLEEGAREARALVPGPSRRASEPARFARAVSASGLRALLAIAAAGSEASAARLLGTAQPSVNRALRELERAFGGVLLGRSSRGTRPTEAGAALIGHVKLAVAQARALESDVAAWRGELRGRVVVGALPLSVALLLPQAVEAVLRAHPGVEVTVVDGTYDSLMRQLRVGDLDLIVGALRADAPDDVRQEALLDDDLAVVARCDHPLFARARPIRARELGRWPWIVPLDGTPASAALRRSFDAIGLAPPVGALQANGPGFTRAAIARTDRLALASRAQALQDAAAGHLRVVPVALPGTTRRIGLTTRSIGDPSPDLQALVAALRRAAREAARVPERTPAAVPAAPRTDRSGRRPRS